MLLYIYPLLYLLAVYFEFKAYEIRHLGSVNLAQAYNRHQKLAFIGRFGPLLGFPIVGYYIDNNVELQFLILVIAIAHFMSALVYRKYSTCKIGFNLKLEFSIWLLGILLHTLGMHLLFVLASIYEENKSMILMMGASVNGIGTFIIVYFIEDKLAKELDAKKGNGLFVYHQKLRGISQIIACGVFLLLYSYAIK